MTQIGVPVPAGLHDHDRRVPRLHGARASACRPGSRTEIAEHVARLEERAGKRLGDPDDPLLLSVRSGAAVSMPGMMDTILNLGLSDVATEGLAKTTANERFAYDSYRRLIQMYGEVVDGIDAHALRAAAHRPEAREGRPAGHRSRRRRPARARRRVQVDLRGGDGQPVPAGRARAADARRPRRLRVVGQPARAGVPPRARHPRRPRHRRERDADGLRQQGRDVGDRRLLHARPGDGRAGPLRRVPAERAGRGRRRGHPHAAAARADAGRRCRRRSTSSSRRWPRSSGTTATCRTSSSPSRRGSSSCSRRAARSAPRRRR